MTIHRELFTKDDLDRLERIRQARQRGNPVLGQDVDWMVRQLVRAHNWNQALIQLERATVTDPADVDDSLDSPLFEPAEPTLDAIKPIKTQD